MMGRWIGPSSEAAASTLPGLVLLEAEPVPGHCCQTPVMASWRIGSDHTVPPPFSQRALGSSSTLF
jgi:hypothetical protein